MNKKRVIALGALVLAIGVGIYWWASGASVWTMTEVPVETKDELFGTTSIQWEPGFRLGLEYAAPAAGGLLVIAGVLLWMVRRDRRRTAGTERPG